MENLDSHLKFYGVSEKGRCMLKRERRIPEESSILSRLKSILKVNGDALMKDTENMAAVVVPKQ